MRFLTLSVVATLMSAPAFAADLGMYRPGTPYNSAVSGGADVCESQCAGDAQCRGWNYVKPNPQAPGICEYLSSVSTPVPSQISISGENMSAQSFSSRVTSGGTNTIRVGTQVTQPTNTVTVGQSQTSRRVVRQPVPQRATAQTASTRPVESMSLTAQQNRYRQAQGQAAGQAHAQVAYPQSQAPRFAPQQADSPEGHSAAGKSASCAHATPRVPPDVRCGVSSGCAATTASYSAAETNRSPRNRTAPRRGPCAVA